MYAFIIILIIIIGILLCGIVLIQNPKGGGVNASFSGASQQIFGAGRSTDVVEKTTWTLVAALLLLTIVSTAFVDKKTVAAAANGKPAVSSSEKTELEKRLNETGGFTTPVAAPTQGGQQQTQPQQTPAQPAEPAKK